MARALELNPTLSARTTSAAAAIMRRPEDIDRFRQGERLAGMPELGKRDEYLKHLHAHAERCRASEPGTLQFDILVPHSEVDTVRRCQITG